MTFSHQTPKIRKQSSFTQPTTSVLNMKIISCHCHSKKKKKKKAIFLGYSQLIRVRIRWDSEVGAR